MTLREWMTKHRLTQARAAERLGITQPEVSMYLRGRTPTLERALLFERNSDGELAPKDWLPPEEHQAEGR